MEPLGKLSKNTLPEHSAKTERGFIFSKVRKRINTMLDQLRHRG